MFGRGDVTRFRWLRANLRLQERHWDAPAARRPAADVTIVGLDYDTSAQTYRIVGSHEADPRRGFVSDASPIGATLLGRGVGDEVNVTAPGGEFRVRIVAIS
jgi:transcription elongation GreA/GreB family factor